MDDEGQAQNRRPSPGGRDNRIVVTGSSQRLMDGLVLDGSAPLFGRARAVYVVDNVIGGDFSRVLKQIRGE